MPPSRRPPKQGMTLIVLGFWRSSVASQQALTGSRAPGLTMLGVRLSSFDDRRWKMRNVLLLMLVLSAIFASPALGARLGCNV